MADTKQATVYIYLDEGPVPAGIMRTNVEGRHTSSEFVYGRKYIERPDAVSVDPVQVPLPAPGEVVTHDTPEGFHVFNGIRDAAPDAWGRFLLEKKFSTKGLDEFDYAAASGDDRVGALAFGESATSGVGIWNTESFVPFTGPGKTLDLAEIQQAVDGADQPDDPNFQKLLDCAPSMGGARPKGTVWWSGGLYIAKFSTSSDSYDMCLAEYATMLMAKDCGINVPNISMSSVEGRTIYLIERFDRILSKDKKIKKRIPFHSALTMTGSHESDYGQHSYKDIVDAITKFSSDAHRDRIELYRRMVFNIFCNNTDDHIRNQGFLYNKDGQWGLSPAYDIVPYPQSTQTYALGLRIGDEGKLATVSNALSATGDYGVVRSDAEQIIDRVREVTKKWKDYFGKCNAADQDVERLSSCFREL
jgi:serine/threonine-protein kinase HipA